MHETAIRRREDGSIDTGFYAARARAERQSAQRHALDLCLDWLAAWLPHPRYHRTRPSDPHLNASAGRS